MLRMLRSVPVPASTAALFPCLLPIPVVSLLSPLSCLVSDLQGHSALAHTSLTLGCRVGDSGVKERFVLMFGPADETSGTVCKHGLAFPPGGSVQYNKRGVGPPLSL